MWPGGPVVSMYWRFLISACFWFSIAWLYNGRSTAAEPGYLDFDNLPDTNFSCDGKVIGGYYADTETGCQMFHVCTIGQKGEITDIKFLCLNGTVFDQETRVCERVDEVDCSKTESFFDLNLELYGNSAAGFGVAEEEESDDLKECDSDSDDCQTDAPHSKQQTSQHKVQGKDSTEEEIYEERGENDEVSTQKTVTLPPTTTTTRQSITSTLPRLQSTTPTPPQVLQYPTTSPETIAALLALHNAFTASLQQHGDPQKIRPNPPRITGFLPTSSTGEFQNQNRPLARPTQFSPREQPHHFSIQKQQYNSQGTKPPGRLQLQHQTSSENYNNMNFHHSFHISSQGSHFPRQSYEDEYSEIESHPSTSSIPRTEHPKPFNFESYEGEEYYSDDNSQSSTPNPFILSSLKINRLNENQDDTKSVLNRGNFIRDLHNQNNNFQTLSFRRQTTPSVSVVTSTSTTSSSSVRSGKPNQSAILTRKPQTKNHHFIHTPSTGEFVPPTVKPRNNTTPHLNVESYDDYQESDVHSDPFFKDVPKISRTRRYVKDTRKNIHYRKFDIFNHFVCSKNMSNIINSSVKVCNIEGHSEILKNWIAIPKNSTIVAIKIQKPLRSISKLAFQIPQASAISTLNSGDAEDENSIYNGTGKQKKTSMPINDLISKIHKYHNIHNNGVHKNTINNKPFKVLTKRSPIEDSIEEVNLYSSRKRPNSNQRTRNVPSTQPKRNYRLSTQTELRLISSNGEEIFVPQQRSSGRRRSEHRNVGRESGTAQDYSDVSQAAIDVSRNRQANTRPNRRKVNSQAATVRARPSTETYSRTPESDSHVSLQQKQPSPVQFSSTRRKYTYSDNYDTISQNNRRKIPLVLQSTAAPIPPLRRPSIVQGSEDPSTVTFVQKQSAQDSHMELTQQGIYREKLNISQIPTTETVTTQLNLKAGTHFSCEDKVKGGYYADVEADCKGFFICTQGKVGDPLLNTHFWCGVGTKFNQRSRTCQAEDRVQCSLSSRYYHLNNDFLVPELEEEFQDSFEPLKI